MVDSVTISFNATLFISRAQQLSLCAEMIEEFRFALRCGATKRSNFQRTCSKCSHTDPTGVESPNGVIQLRELRRSPMSGVREYRSPSPLPDLYTRDFGRPSSPLPTFADDRRASIYSDYLHE